VSLHSCATCQFFYTWHNCEVTCVKNIKNIKNQKLTRGFDFNTVLSVNGDDQIESFFKKMRTKLRQRKT